MKTESAVPPAHGFSNSFAAGRSESRRILVWGLLTTLFFAALFALNPTLLQRFDFMTYDLLLKNFPDNHASGRLVIVDLDEKSLNRYGQWPWPRYRIAELLDKITALGPTVIGLDVFFAEPDRTSVGWLLKDMGEVYRLDLAVDRLPAELSDNDRILAQTLARGPFVLGNKFHFNRHERSSDQCVLHPVEVSSIHNAAKKEEGTGLPESTGVLCNLPILSEEVSASGFLNFSPDRDGMLRRIPMLVQYNGAVYPSLALAVVLKLKGVNHIVQKKRRNHAALPQLQGDLGAC